MPLTKNETRKKLKSLSKNNLQELLYFGQMKNTNLEHRFSQMKNRLEDYIYKLNIHPMGSPKHNRYKKKRNVSKKNVNLVNLLRSARTHGFSLPKAKQGGATRKT